METRLPSTLLETPEGKRANDILRRCVHCGFCNATCPTYQLEGNELDGPRGRIYLIKSMLEGNAPGDTTGIHLDRCLNCLACETTCPSGVAYGQLLEIGRQHLATQAPDSMVKRALQHALVWFLLCRPLFEWSLRCGQLLRPLLPKGLRQKLPEKQVLAPKPATQHQRKVILPLGCVQPGLRPGIDRATTRVLDQLGIGVISLAAGGCCGALPQHRGNPDKAKALARANISSWYPVLRAGAECILSNASGCGVAIKDYPALLADEPEWRERAEYCAGLSLDLVEFLEQEDLSLLAHTDSTTAFSLHSPCTLQHGQRLPGRVASLLKKLGFNLLETPDDAACCGSAGLYSVFQPTIAGKLRANKLKALQQAQPQVILTANIGCLMHLQAGTSLPVRHWVEEIASR